MLDWLYHLARLRHLFYEDYHVDWKRTAVAAPDHGQARAAGRRPRVVAAQREAPEEAAAAIERAEQGRAVLLVGGSYGLLAAVVRSRSICSARGRQ